MGSPGNTCGSWVARVHTVVKGQPGYIPWLKDSPGLHLCGTACPGYTCGVLPARVNTCG